MSPLSMHKNLRNFSQCFTFCGDSRLITANLEKLWRVPMSRQRTILFALLGLIVTCVTATTVQTSAPAAEVRSAPEQLTSDTPRATSAGASFTVPAGWALVTGKNIVILDPPETDTHIAIVDS